MSAHTPGPWFVGGSFHHSGERQRVTPIYARDPDRLDGRWLVAWCHHNAVPAKQRKPNARLIAAAPELLGHHEANLADLWLLRAAIEAGDPDRELLIRVADMERRCEIAIAKATQP